MKARPTSKAYLIGQMASAPSGTTQQELRAATGWVTVPMPHIAKQCGMKLITQREKGEIIRNHGKFVSKKGHFTRYFMVPHHPPKTEQQQ